MRSPILSRVWRPLLAVGVFGATGFGPSPARAAAGDAEDTLARRLRGSEGALTAWSSFRGAIGSSLGSGGGVEARFGLTNLRVPSALPTVGSRMGDSGGGIVRTLVLRDLAEVEFPVGGGGPRPMDGGGLNIVINPTAGLLANPTALAAFNAAAATWESVLADPITVTINADLAALNPGIIGSTGSAVFTGFSYAALRGQLVADNVGSPTASVTAALPVLAPTFFAPANVTGLSLVATAANLKALGFTLPAGADASITFSSNFAFDYDNSDGVTPGLMDFETVALHEIGHALGFVSGVDQVDFLVAGGSNGSVGVHPLDLFRFGPSANPSTLVEFGSMNRDLRANVAANTDLIVAARGSGPEYAMSTGVDTGDGRQASHWKDGDLSGNTLGLMDPTLDFGQINAISSADLNAFDAIGWEVVPEPHEYGAAFAVGLAAFAAWRSRNRGRFA